MIPIASAKSTGQQRTHNRDEIDEQSQKAYVYNLPVKYMYLPRNLPPAQNYFNSVISSSNMIRKLNGSNAIPSPMKCLLIASTQCKRSECNIALVPSITTKTAIVSPNQMAKKTKTTKMPNAPLKPKAMLNVMSQRTMLSC